MAVERSAIRVERYPKRTEENVATASTSVPAAVAKDAIVGQSTAKRRSVIHWIFPLQADGPTAYRGRDVKHREAALEALDSCRHYLFA